MRVIEDKMLTVSDVGRRLLISPRTVHRLIDRGDLPAVRITPRGTLRFLARDVDALIESRRIRNNTKEN